jgi:hypothetical protein
VNGAIINNSAISIDGAVISYDPLQNEGYELTNGDEVQIYYVIGSADSGSTGSARLAVQVNGVTDINGTRQAAIGDEITTDVNGILLLTPNDNVSVSVLNSSPLTLNIMYSMLSVTMIRGV